MKKKGLSNRQSKTFNNIKSKTVNSLFQKSFINIHKEPKEESPLISIKQIKSTKTGNFIPNL